jgi:uncharacterized metal-binding protein YceD (DUF177 family)
VKTSKLTFGLQEIPEGKSNRTIVLSADEFELDDEVSLQKGNVDVEFYKTDHFIKVRFEVHADAGLICDRSLKSFTQEVEGDYTLLFDPNPIEESVTDKETVRQISSDDLTISIEKEVRDTIMLNVPTRKIHPDYLDEDGNPTSFEVQSFGRKDDDEEETIDPRWAELKKLK